jgi:hypothetical protein
VIQIGLARLIPVPASRTGWHRRSDWRPASKFNFVLTERGRLERPERQDAVHTGLPHKRDDKQRFKARPQPRDFLS